MAEKLAGQVPHLAFLLQAPASKARSGRKRLVCFVPELSALFKSTVSHSVLIDLVGVGIHS